MGELEAMAPTHTYCVFVNQDELTDDVGWNITGSDAGNVKVLIRTKEYKTARLVANTVTRLQRAERKISIKSPQKQQALQVAGIGGSLTDVRQAKKTVTDLRNTMRNAR